MAKLTRSNSLSALAEGDPVFTAGTSRFTIGITSTESGLSYHLHLTADDAERLATFLAERVEVKPFHSMR
jgi:hypothetical protein